MTKPFSMRIPTSTGDRFDFDSVLLLDADDDEIAAAVDDADLPALMAALSVLTGDADLISDDLVPPRPQMLAKTIPHGGMSENAQKKARMLAVEAIKKARDHGWPNTVTSDDLLVAAIRYLTNDAQDDYMPLLRHEISLPEDRGAPKWRKDDIAPDRDFKALVIGAGAGGLAAAYRLSQAGIAYSIVEKSADVGGVWWDNRYPGCRLDTPNFAYSFSFAQKTDWPQQFSERSEILKYMNQVADRGGLREHMMFSTEVVSMRYDTAKSGWWVDVRQSGKAETLFANVVISSVGHLNRPQIPQIEGQNRFRGRAFHSAEWQEDCDVTGKRVAVIGTGASGFQIVPSIIDRVEKLKVFQRNPAWMLSTPSYHEDIKPGMKWLLSHVPYYGRWFRFWQFWVAAEGRFPAVITDRGWSHPISVSALNEKLRQGCLENLREQVGNREDLFEKLTPKYPPGAKRMVRDNGAYIASLLREHAELITSGIERLCEDGIVTRDGDVHVLDVIIYATGFLASDYLEPICIEGKDGQGIHDYWGGDCRAYLGISVPGFPNFFMLGGPNSSFVVNGSAIFTAESSLEYAMHAIEYLLRSEAGAVDVKLDVYEGYNAEIDKENSLRAWSTDLVGSWYQGRSGRATVTWPYPILEYFKRTQVFDSTKYTTYPKKNRRSA